MILKAVQCYVSPPTGLLYSHSLDTGVLFCLHTIENTLKKTICTQQSKQFLASFYLSRNPEASEACEMLQEASERRRKAQVNSSSSETTLKHLLGKGRGRRSSSPLTLLKPPTMQMKWGEAGTLYTPLVQRGGIPAASFGSSAKGCLIRGIQGTADKGGEVCTECSLSRRGGKLR